MAGYPRYRLSLILLLCTALLAVRTVGDHLHLCFDGSEPPVTLHGVDGDFDHQSPSVAGGHHDVDVDLFHATLAKNTPDVAITGLPSIALPLLAPAGWVQRIGPPETPVLPSPIRHFRPPLRGPPSTTLS